MSIPKLSSKFAVCALAVLPFSAFAGSMEIPGLPNFHQVSENVYRGGQPLPEGWQALAKMGVKTVIDLRREDEHSTADEARAVKAAGMQYVNFPLKGVVAPDNEVVAKVLALLNSGTPVFLHCKRGADRTGAMIACYRVAHDHWQNDQAVKEAKSLGMRWTQVGLRQYALMYRPPSNAPGAVAATVTQAATLQP
ncbi:MAG TPA: tyrosine-protein phosphatase [Bryobacteraceae bacterium]